MAIKNALSTLLKKRYGGNTKIHGSVYRKCHFLKQNVGYQCIISI